eukprot:6863460-Prymnesium_polylepis.1
MAHQVGRLVVLLAALSASDAYLGVGLHAARSARPIACVGTQRVPVAVPEPSAVAQTNIWKRIELSLEQLILEDSSALDTVVGLPDGIATYNRDAITSYFASRPASMAVSSAPTRLRHARPPPMRSRTAAPKRGARPTCRRRVPSTFSSPSAAFAPRGTRAARATPNAARCCGPSWRRSAPS